jgi:general secretion pathway protein G
MATVLSHRRAEPGVFFPWERKSGLLGSLGRRRMRVLAGGAFLTVAVVATYEDGERGAAVRATRATLTTARRAIDAYRADHGGACPRALGELVTLGHSHADPVDAWGHPLRLVCPGRKDPVGFDLSSDGPDGLPGGLDQVE